MLNENIKALRKAKGISQEELAVRLNVVRQTISKWEKGISVPDADMVAKIAEILEVPVGDLLGVKIEPNLEANSIVEQLSRLNEQLAKRNRRSKRIWKVVLGILVVILLLLLFNAAA